MSLRRVADAAQLYADAVNRSANSPTTGVNRTATPPNTPNNQPPPTSPGAVVQISHGARFFANLLALAKATPDLRADVVAAAKTRSAQELDPTEVEQLATKLMPPAQH